ncbi:ABC transporter permease [Nakamurella silvestris]|nr:ABC transporter permease [Nakamurella silvestris]
MSDLTKSGGPRPGQGHFLADPDETPLQATDTLSANSEPSSLWQDAWRSLRKNPIFLISALMILFVLFVAFFPGVFTSEDPNYCVLSRSPLNKGTPPVITGYHPWGFDIQGCDVLARAVYGAKASVTVGVGTTILVVLVGGVVGALAGFYGGWFDSILSRITDIFFALPLILGAIIVLQLYKGSESVWRVVVVLALFGWPQIARITRGAVISVKGADFITASTALGATRFKSLVRHVVPNSLAPVIVTATVSLGIYIVSEATLSFLGLGLPQNLQSWGAQISSAQSAIRTAPMMLFYPSAALAITVLSFILLGDAVREALDPKARKR